MATVPSSRLCRRCDVRWRGVPTSTCWECGGVGGSALPLPHVGFSTVTFDPDEHIERGEG